MKLHMTALFNEKKAAQAAAFFLFKAHQRRGNLTVLKLMKLMYLAERASYQEYGEPLCGDALVSMPHGPVLSMTLNLINGLSPSSKEGWDKWVAEKNGRDMALRHPDLVTSPDGLDALSAADVDVLESIWKNFGKLSAKKLEAYTHDPAHCPEWEDPDGSSMPIDHTRLFSALGYSEKESLALLGNIQQQAWINQTLAATTAK